MLFVRFQALVNMSWKLGGDTAEGWVMGMRHNGGSELVGDEASEGRWRVRGEVNGKIADRATTLP